MKNAIHEVGGAQSRLGFEIEKYKISTFIEGPAIGLICSF